MAGRNPPLLLTATLLASTLEVALPNLQVEVTGAEGESLQGEAILAATDEARDSERQHSSASVIPPSVGAPQEHDRAVQYLQVLVKST